MAHSLQSIFKNKILRTCKTFDNESVLFLLDALVRLATTSTTTLSSTASAVHSMFSMQKLVETSLCNVRRVDVIWSLIMPFLVEVAAHKVT